MAKTIEISDETWAKIKDQVEGEIGFKEINELKDMVGEKFFFRTVTYHLTGKFKKVTCRQLKKENLTRLSLWVKRT